MFCYKNITSIHIFSATLKFITRRKKSITFYYWAHRFHHNWKVFEVTKTQKTNKKISFCSMNFYTASHSVRVWLLRFDTVWHHWGFYFTSKALNLHSNKRWTVHSNAQVVHLLKLSWFFSRIQMQFNYLQVNIRIVGHCQKLLSFFWNVAQNMVLRNWNI